MLSIAIKAYEGKSLHLQIMPPINVLFELKCLHGTFAKLKKRLGSMFIIC